MFPLELGMGTTFSITFPLASNTDRVPIKEVSDERPND